MNNDLQVCSARSSATEDVDYLCGGARASEKIRDEINSAAAKRSERDAIAR